MNYIEQDLFVEENDIQYKILIGRNAKGNDIIIKMSHPQDLWFHLDNISSPHIILQSHGDSIPKKYINQVAGMLFEYKKNAPNNCNVIYTQIENVKLSNVHGTVTTKKLKILKF